MIGLQITTQDLTRNLESAVTKTGFKNLRHAAARMSKDAKASLVTAEGPSAAGEAPHTHQGAYLRRAVRYAVDDDGAVIGPMASVVGEAGAAHEFGGEFHGTEYPERPFMGPTLDKNIDRFAGDWAGSLGE